MDREKPYFIKRVVAYAIDFVIVTLFATVLSMILIKNTASYQQKTEQLMELTRKYTAGEISKEQYSKDFDELNYYVTREGVGTTIINCSTAIVYYVILCYFCHGITLGKYFMRLRIVSNSDKELNIGVILKVTIYSYLNN